MVNSGRASIKSAAVSSSVPEYTKASGSGSITGTDPASVIGFQSPITAINVPSSHGVNARYSSSPRSSSVKTS